jgi:nucleotide-binding universal stress UspA family protein
MKRERVTGTPLPNLHVALFPYTSMGAGKRMFHTILVALDGSKGANFALEYAIAEAKRWNAQLYAVHVISPGGLHPLLVDTTCNEDERRTCEFISSILDEEGNIILKDAEATAQAGGIGLYTRIEWGQPADRIIAAAQDIGADLIVLGHRGVSDLRELFLGRVSAAVVEYSPVTTLIVHR